MSSAPDIDPYVVLGVQKDATLPEIRTAHRKLVLKCHPDKIKDESQRSKAQDEFQKVQQAYELLSDDAKRTKYDQKVRLAELRREMMARGGSPYASPRGSASSGREYRDGRIYEERTPADSFFEEEVHFTEEPRPMSRKYDEYKTRQRSKPTEEKKKPKVPPTTTRSAKDVRDSTKATHSDRAKYRTKERRREVFEKTYERGYGDSDDDGGSDSSASSIYVRVKRPSESRRSRESSSRKPKPAAEPTRRSNSTRYEDDYSDEYPSKHDKLQHTARDYILRSKGTVPIEIDSRHRPSRPSRSPPRHRDYESPEPESSSSRRSGRSKRSTQETPRSSTSRHNSYEHLEPQQARAYEHKVPSMPTASSQKLPPRPSLQATRSATTYSHSRSKRDTLLNMVYPDGNTRTTKLRGDKYDSGYSSPGTPEMPPGESPSKTSTRYKIVTEPDTVVVEPPSHPSHPPHPSPRRTKTYAPTHQERPVRPAPKPMRSSTTYSYTPETANRFESTRPSNPRQSSSRPLFGEVEYMHRGSGKEKDSSKYAREVGPDRDGYSRHYDDYRNPPMGRRQSAYA